MPGVRAKVCLVAALAGCGAACSSSNDITRAPVTTIGDAEGPRPPAARVDGRLPSTARPLRYALSLAIDPAQDRFSGHVTIQIDVPAPTRHIVMHGRDLTIASVEVLAGGDALPATATNRRGSGGKGSPEEIVLALPRTLEPGRAEIRIAYSAPFGDRLVGLYRVSEGGQSYAFSQLEPMDARRVFPCFDEPAFKVPFEVKVTTPKGNLVVANAEEVERTETEDKKSLVFRFAPTPPLPTYLLGVAVGPLEVKERPGSPVPLRLVTTAGKTKHGDLVLEAAAAHVAILADYTARPFPYAKLDLVAVPDFAAGAMENAGLVTFNEELILLDPGSASTRARRTMAEVVAHEVAHHWFGNLVTMPWWDDLWLNEGLATWFESRVVDTWRPAMDARLEALGGKAWVMGIDALDSARAVRQPVTNASEAEEAFDGITYVKGASVMEMVERWIGPEAFQKGVRAYVRAHEHGSATSADLFRALDESSGKSVGAVAATFLDRPGVPLVRAELSCDATSAKVKVTQSRYGAMPDKNGDLQWRIPVCVLAESGQKEPSTACTMLETRDAEIPLLGKKCPKWIYPNADEAGYFRFALSADQQRALVAAAPSLPPRVRFGLVTNSRALVESGDLGADALVDLIEGMKKERSRLVVDQLVHTLRWLSDTLVDAETRPAFKRLASAMLLPAAKELGWKAGKNDAEERRLLRLTVLEALATVAEDPWLDKEADARATSFLKDPRSVDSDTAAIALTASCRRAGEARVDELGAALGRTSTAEDRSIAISALGSFRDEKALRRALDFTLTGKLKAQEIVRVLSAANSWPESRPIVATWLDANVSGLTARVPGPVLIRVSELAATACEKKARDGIAGVLGKALADVEGADRPLREALESADDCMQIRARSGDATKKRLLAKRRQDG